jgi:hypothetical protein
MAQRGKGLIEGEKWRGGERGKDEVKVRTKGQRDLGTKRYKVRNSLVLRQFLCELSSFPSTRDCELCG